MIISLEGKNKDTHLFIYLECLKCGGKELRFSIYKKACENFQKSIASAHKKSHFLLSLKLQIYYLNQRKEF